MTTSRIIGGNFCATPLGSTDSVPSVVVGISRISCGKGILPVATVAAATAIPNGVVCTFPCPIPASTRSATDVGVGTDPALVVIPATVKSTPIPNCLAAPGSADGGRSAANCPNVVLQDWANARRSGTVPNSNLPSLGMVRVPIVATPGHSTGVSIPTAPGDNDGGASATEADEPPPLNTTTAPTPMTAAAVTPPATSTNVLSWPSSKSPQK